MLFKLHTLSSTKFKDVPQTLEGRLASGVSHSKQLIKLHRFGLTRFYGRQREAQHGGFGGFAVFSFGDGERGADNGHHLPVRF